LLKRSAYAGSVAVSVFFGCGPLVRFLVAKRPSFARRNSTPSLTVQPWLQIATLFPTLSQYQAFALFYSLLTMA
jgi:hypothetical protein